MGRGKDAESARKAKAFNTRYANLPQHEQLTYPLLRSETKDNIAKQTVPLSLDLTSSAFGRNVSGLSVSVGT